MGFIYIIYIFIYIALRTILSKESTKETKQKNEKQMVHIIINTVAQQNKTVAIRSCFCLIQAAKPLFYFYIFGVRVKIS